MDNDNDKQPEETTTPAENIPETATTPEVVPVDALSMTPDELEEQSAESASNTPQPEQPKVKLSPLKRVFRVVNVYFLLFLLLLVVAAIIAAVNYLNSQKPAPEANISSQQLSEEALRQLANSDTSVGNNSQTLTIQGNAVINGQTLARGNLNVAGNVQTGGSLQAPSLTISGNVNLGTTQISSLQVAQNLAVQGTTTLRNLNVSGTSTFNGPVTVPQITATSIVLSSNATLNVPGHIRFTGKSPARTINPGVLGNGGSASIDGSDTSGTININTGANPTAGCFINLTFAQRFTNKPHVLISPVNKAAGQLQYYVTRDNNGFSVCTANVATARQSFAFDYFITN